MLAWVSVGKGAIGLLSACNLKLSGVDVSLFLKEPQNIEVEFKGQKLHFTPVSAPISNALVAVKSYDVKNVLIALLPHLTDDAQIVLSHNGIIDLAPILAFLKPNQGLWFLTTTHGALKKQQEVLHTGLGQSVLACLNDAAKAKQNEVFKAMDIALGPVSFVSEIMPFLWKKLAINAAINPLTAILNCQNGELVDKKHLATLTQIVNEVCSVAKLAGYELNEEQTLTNLLEVASKTANNYSSMHQDIAHGRQSEINAINGYVVTLAKEYGVDVPLNATLQQKILQLQHQTN